MKSLYFCNGQQEHFKLKQLILKKALLFFTLLLFSFAANAQQSDSIVMSPANPSAIDTVKFYIYLSFPQGGCADVANSSVSGNDIYGNSFHCMGNTMSICYDVDTIVVSPLLPGNYTFYYSLDAGFGPPGNCSAAFLPYDYDTIAFSVTTVLGIESNIRPVEYSLFPNPASDHVNFSNPENKAVNIEMFNNMGKLILSKNTGSTISSLDISELTPGIYFYRITDAEGFSSAGKLNVNK
ncbi:hypothetical protein BH11BAC7_BH11BAC7_04090 [soil metagenome]